MQPKRISLCKVLLSTILITFATNQYANDLSFKFIQASPEVFAQPHDIVLSADGTLLYVADNGNDRIVVLDAAGRMYIADKYSNSIKIVDADGKLLQVLGSKKSGKGPGVFDRPEGVEIRGNDIWFSDT